MPDLTEILNGGISDRLVRHDDAVDIMKAHGMIHDDDRSRERFDRFELRIVQLGSDQDHSARVLRRDAVQLGRQRIVIAVDDRQVDILERKVLLNLIDNRGDKALVFLNDHAVFSIFDQEYAAESFSSSFFRERIFRFDQVAFDAFSRLIADADFVVEDDRHGSGGYA